LYFAGVAGNLSIVAAPISALITVAAMPFDRSVFDEIDTNLRTLEIDEIKAKLELFMIGYEIECPIFDPGAFLYRARAFSPTFNKTTGMFRKDLIYPPANITPLGRLNRAGEPVFYCSMSKESVFFEDEPNDVRQ
jgi:hypothetical protein